MVWLIFFSVVILAVAISTAGNQISGAVNNLTETIKNTKIGFTITTISKNDDEDDWWKHPKN